MGSQTKEARRGINPNDFSSKHSQNQRFLRIIGEGEKWLYPHNKSTKAEEKRMDLPTWRNHQVVRLFDKDKEELTPEDLNYLWNHADDHGKGITYPSNGKSDKK